MAAMAADMEGRMADVVATHRPGGMVTGFIALVEYLDDEGEPSYTALTPPDARAITSLGQAHALVLICQDAFDNPE